MKKDDILMKHASFMSVTADKWLGDRDLMSKMKSRHEPLKKGKTSR